MNHSLLLDWVELGAAWVWLLNGNFILIGGAAGCTGVCNCKHSELL